MGDSTRHWRKTASLWLLVTLAGVFSTARGGERWWEKDFGIGFRWSSGFFSRGFYDRSSPKTPIDAYWAYYGVTSDYDKRNRYDVGTRQLSYEVFLTLWDQRLVLSFGRWEHSNSPFVKESPPQQFAGDPISHVYVWEAEYSDKVTYGGYTIYFPILTSETVGRFSLGLGMTFGSMKKAIVHYRTYLYYTSGSYQNVHLNQQDSYVIMSATAFRGGLTLRYDLPFFPVSFYLSCLAQGAFLDHMKNWGEWEIREDTITGHFKATGEQYREWGNVSCPGFSLLEIVPAVSFTLPF